MFRTELKLVFLAAKSQLLRDLPRLLLFLNMALLLEAALYYWTVSQGRADFSKSIYLPACAWVMIVVAGLSCFRSCYADEIEQGVFFGRLVNPADSLAVLIGKSAAAMLVLLPVQALVIAAHIVALVDNFDPDIPAMMMVTVLGVFGFSIMGAAVSGSTLLLKRASFLFPISLFLAASPVIFAGSRLLREAVENGKADSLQSYFILVAYNVLGPILVWSVFDGVVRRRQKKIGKTRNTKQFLLKTEGE